MHAHHHSQLVLLHMHMTTFGCLQIDNELDNKLHSSQAVTGFQGCNQRVC